VAALCRGRWLGATLASAWSLAQALPASAHVGHVVQRAERYVKLDVTPGDARVVVSLSLGPSEMEGVLRAADVDLDGDVTSEEAETYVLAFGEALDRDITVRVGGERVKLDWGEPFLQPAGQVRLSPGTVELVGHAELGGGRVPIVFEDRMQRPVLDRTDVSLEARDGARLVAAGFGAAPEGVEPRLAFGPEAARPVIFGAVVETPEALVPSRASGAFPWVISAMSIAGVLGFFASRALRRLRARGAEPGEDQRR
jgi:hypothetical protein